MARVGLARLEYLLERVDRALDMEASDVTVNSLISDTGVTVTAGGLTVTAGNFEVVAGKAYLKGTEGIVRYQGAPAALTAHQHAITGANMLTGILTCAATGSHSKPTEDGGALCTALGLGTNGDSFDFSLLNTATTGGHNVTLNDSASNVTIVGNPIVAARDDTNDAISVGVGKFRVRRTSAGVVVIYRIG
tara:strand:- start:57 stop:629 length:573 start_codon:yes stop_codon:yes gene_type:complete